MQRLHAALRKRTAALVPELARRLEERVGATARQGGGRARSGWSRRRPCSPSAATSPRSWSASTATSTASASCCSQKGSVGKAIDFLMQEIHREINTIASKSGDLEVTNLTLEAKGEIEKLREQVQNVE